MSKLHDAVGTPHAERGEAWGEPACTCHRRLDGPPTTRDAMIEVARAYTGRGAMTALEMLRKSLEEGGYDGLFLAGECACLDHDLAPCGGVTRQCKPGYRHDHADGTWTVSQNEPEKQGG